MTRFEKSRLSCTQHQDTLFTIKWYVYTLTNNSARYWWWKLPKAAFAVACFWGLSDVHECSGRLQMTPHPLDKQTACYNSTHDWLMCLAMDLAALRDTWRWKWHQWMSFGCFSEYVSFPATSWLPARPPPSHARCGSASGIGCVSKKLSEIEGNSAS